MIPPGQIKVKIRSRVIHRKCYSSYLFPDISGTLFCLVPEKAITNYHVSPAFILIKAISTWACFREI
jgi:hypothetical protein